MLLVSGYMMINRNMVEPICLSHTYGYSCHSRHAELRPDTATKPDIQGDVDVLYASVSLHPTIESPHTYKSLTVTRLSFGSH